MKRKNVGWLMAIAGLVLLLGSVTALTAAAYAPGQAEDPITVVKAYYDAYNNDNVEGAMQFIGPDTLFINPIGTFKGVDEIRAHLQSLVNDNLSFKLSDFKNDNGRVTYAYEVIIGGDVVETGADGLTIVQNGKIVFDGTVNTEPQIPTTGMEPNTLTLLWVATGGLVLAGLGLVVAMRNRRTA